MRPGNSLFIIIIGLLLVGCEPKCTTSELNAYLEKTDSMLTEFRATISFGFNHPALKPSLAHEMKGMWADIRIMNSPKCARKYQVLLLGAMQSSIRFFANDKDRYYSRSELSQIADDKWRLVEIERERMTSNYGANP